MTDPTDERPQMIERLQKLCDTIPASVRDGAYQTVIDWKKHRVAALKVASKRGVEVGELTAAISNMERFK
jgi:hypothetical protein